MSEISKSKQAETLANQPYSEIVFRDRTTDDDYIYVALNPELEGCAVQGETISEALENLHLFRIDYIEHLLSHNLTVPGPALPYTGPAAKLPQMPTIVVLSSSLQDGEVPFKIAYEAIS